MKHILLVAASAVLLSSPAWGQVASTATYYIDPVNGNDANPGTQSQPFRTLGQGVSVLTPGDTLYVRAGTYNGVTDNAIPGGTSWSAPVTVAAYPGEQPVLVPKSSGGFVLSFYNNQYIVIDGFMVDATGGYDGMRIGASSHHIRIQNSEIKNAPQQGILIGGDDNEFLNLKLHDNGQICEGEGLGLCHGIYIQTKRNLLERSEIYDNWGWGVHLYNTPGGADNNVVRNNKIYNNGRSGRGPGMILSEGDGNIAYNNILWGNRKGGIQIDFGVTNPQAYNNTVYANDDGSGVGGIYIGQYSSGAIIRNNIVYNNLGFGQITNDGSGTTIESNLTADPQLVNPAAGDFHLQSSSPAIDVGLTLLEVPTDIDGVSRPQGSGYDIGAYEFKVGGTLRGDLNGDGKRDLADVRGLIYMLLGQQDKTPEAELTGDGAVTLADVQALIKLMVGMP